MDRKSILVLVVSFILLMLWYPLIVNKLYPPKPLPAGMTNAPAGPTNQAHYETYSPTSAPAPTRLVGPLAAAETLTNHPAQLLEFTNAYAHYTFTSRGGGLQKVQLLRYPETVSAGEAKPSVSRTNVATLNPDTPAPTLALLDGQSLPADVSFRLARIPGGIRATATLANGLRIIKEFRPSSNYLISATVTLENTSSNALALPAQDWVVGTATPMNPEDKGVGEGLMWYNGKKSENILGASYFSPRGFACIPRIPPAEYRGGEDDVHWAAIQNQFFTLAVMPKAPAQAVVLQKVLLPGLFGGGTGETSTNAEPPVGYLAALVYPEITLAPHGVLARNFDLYAGPKEYRTLARLAERFNNNIDLVMGYSGFFGFFAKGLLLAMNWLHTGIGISYGWAIIAITVIIKTVFWPLTQASTRSMKRMQALQPQMKAIQEKYKDDPAKMNKKTMEFMKEHKVSPLGGCLPMLLQIPVFFGFYRMILSAIELRGARFLWVSDLSKPDTLFIIPGTHFPFNLLPLLMGATMLWQAQLTPAQPGMDQAQAKMMRYMPLLFMVFLYNFSAGLTLYWTVQNLLTILQTKLTKTTPEPAPANQRPVLTPARKRKK